MLGQVCYNNRMKKVLTKANYRTEYVAEGQWRCSKSPTEAHYWVVVSRSMTCKYCSENRDLSLKIVIPPIKA
jgi:CRISPR/Cas system-associated exonuclease Cas4 (RecB family)